ncbi:unnamed protein product [Rotaria magnacalcarata]|uniref:Uncharacterized protein n=1 Tax=Rotaria magnacalcarata TaxID=392030 RepID=A0A816X8D6_9BILA|nr:unnamed protein product [Rotaria magnacalcarata]CAF1608380.1 unnamed protein product [Rotaria magnacalcarata]CAF2143426.1 unnamed protein product [Rotaria magnacalcarata]CAF3826474.1 unnamed protein product [Rotaria magnacalcarata]CAF3850053.1 unnamed protein product [Rotaria magnacalcarata]
MPKIGPGFWKILLGIGVGLAFIGFILGWIGFGVPDWHAFQRYNGSTLEFYGLWAYCQQPAPLYNTICRHWSDASNQLFNGTEPNFLSAADGLITIGMIMLSLGLIVAVVTAILPLLAYVAGALTVLGFIFLIIGLPIFGQQSNNLSKLRGDATYNKHYGFWLIVPTIILAFLAAILFIVTGYYYQRHGFGNLASHSYSRRPYGGQRLLGPANLLNGMPYAAYPRMMPNPYQYQTALQGPSLLSQYIARRMPQYYGPSVIRRASATAFPQPSIIRATGQPPYVAPAYYRPPVVQSGYAPRVNRAGRALAGPPVRVV